MIKQVSCAPECGFKLATHDEKELVSMVQQHAKGAHNKSMSREEVMAMAQDVEE